MTEKLQQFVNEKIAKLPKEVRDAISTFDWVKATEQIGKKYLLNETEISYLQVETLFVLTGVTNGEFFATNVENHVGTTKDDAEKIADEIFENIFDPMGNFMEESLKRNLNKETDWRRSMDFIMSGGDYDAFAENSSKADAADTKPNQQKLVGSSNVIETKRKLLG